MLSHKELLLSHQLRIITFHCILSSQTINGSLLNWFLSFVIMELFTESLFYICISMRETHRHLKYICYCRMLPRVIRCRYDRLVCKKGNG
jgi:hypothetical protein